MYSMYTLCIAYMKSPLLLFIDGCYYTGCSKTKVSLFMYLSQSSFVNVAICDTKANFMTNWQVFRSFLSLKFEVCCTENSLNLFRKICRFRYGNDVKLLHFVIKINSIHRIKAAYQSIVWFKFEYFYRIELLYHFLFFLFTAFFGWMKGRITHSHLNCVVCRIVFMNFQQPFKRYT